MLSMTRCCTRKCVQFNELFCIKFNLTLFLLNASSTCFQFTFISIVILDIDHSQNPGLSQSTECSLVLEQDPQALTFLSSSQRVPPVRRGRLRAADARGSDRQADLNRRELQGTLGGGGGGAPSPLGRTLTGVGPGAAGWRVRRSAESNKWSDYPITSWSTSVPQKDMARRETDTSHLATTTSERMLKTFNSSARALGAGHGEAQCKVSVTRQLANAGLCGVAQYPGRTEPKARSAGELPPEVTVGIQRRLEEKHKRFPLYSPGCSSSAQGFYCTTRWRTQTPAHPHSPSQSRLPGGRERAERRDGERWWRLTVHPQSPPMKTATGVQHQDWTPEFLGRDERSCVMKEAQMTERREKFHTFH